MPIELKVPAVGESITEVEIGQWLKKEGDTVAKDENIVVIESEKATVELPAPAAGRLGKILKPTGQTAAIGDTLALIEPGNAGPSTPPSKPAATPAAAPAPAPAAKNDEAPSRIMPAAQRVMAEKNLTPADVKPTGPGGRVLKEDALRATEPAATPAAAPDPDLADSGNSLPHRREEIVRMSRLRRTVADRLVQAQQQAALLTTFNEADMSSVMTLRREHGEAFKARHGVKLGFMSFFVKAVVESLKEIPQLNAEIRGTDIVFKNYFDIGIAIGGGKGLVVPILRNAEQMSFAEIEKAIGDFGARAGENKIKIEELQGGTFTISNGGVYGSLLSTPIVNPPQSGVLGMHTIQERPVALNGAVVIRPMMYIALTYDHRVVDGREAVTFLKRVKDNIETPARILLEI